MRPLQCPCRTNATSRIIVSFSESVLRASRRYLVSFGDMTVKLVGYCLSPVSTWERDLDPRLVNRTCRLRNRSDHAFNVGHSSDVAFLGHASEYLAHIFSKKIPRSLWIHADSVLAQCPYQYQCPRLPIGLGWRQNAVRIGG